MRRAGLFLAALLAFLLPDRARAFGYPALDTASHWSIQDWGFSPQYGFYVQGASVPVWTAPGQRQYKSVFYHLAVLGARLNDRTYRLANPDYLGQMDGGTYLVRYSSFRVDPGLTITVVMYFHDSGEFETYAYFQGSAFVPGSPWELILRADYDLGSAGNNIAEFLWSPASEGASTSPPQYPRSESADGRLVYQASPGGPSYWSALPHEMAVAYPALQQTEGAGVENAGLARILNAAQPQFGMVLWGDANAPCEIVLKDYGYYDGTLNPTANPGSALQLTGEADGRPRYAYSGRDQMLFLKLRVPSSGTLRFRAKAFQRPYARPLTVRVFQHPPEYLGGWEFDPDMVVRYTADGPRTFRAALSDLVGNGAEVNILTAAQGLPRLGFDGFAGPGQSVSDERLHAAMASARSAAQPYPGSVRDYQVDVLLVDWTSQSEPGAWENLFDKGAADVNRIGREGAAVFWPHIGGGADFQRRQAVLSALHGVGLALNMQPAWSNCPFRGYCWSDPSACGGVRCGASCPSGAANCQYRAHSCEQECTEGTIMSLTDVDRNLIRFNSAPAQGATHSEVDWYRRAPEAWVKPGRFGIAPAQGPQLPPFAD